MQNDKYNNDCVCDNDDDDDDDNVDVDEDENVVGNGSVIVLC